MSDEDLKFAVVALSAIFFVIDPLATMPIFLTITSGDTIEQRRRTALRGAIAAWFTLTTFAIAGGLIFQALGISLGAFKIAGGLMLLLMARRRRGTGVADMAGPQGGALTADEERRLAGLVKPEDR